MEQVERLCGLLDEELGVCAELGGVLRVEQRAVVDMRAEAILQCLEQRAALQQRLAELAATRRGVVQALTADLDPPSTQVSELLPRLPLQRQDGVRRRMRALRAGLLEARSLERQTNILARSSLDHVDDVLQALRGLMPGARYDAGANLTLSTNVGSVSHRA
jgi:flagellar biosynthesis/type III secretory pathway chaperone